MQRRTVIKLLAAGGLIGASAAAFKGIAGSSLWNKSQNMVSRTRMGMGTYVTISVTDPSGARAEEAIERAFKRMERLEASLSRFESSSAVSRLNQKGRLASPPRELLEVLELAFKANRMSAGAFDVTIAPILALYEKSFAKGFPPAESDLRQIVELVGSGHIKISTAEVSFDRSGMSLTLDGVAKGYIVDAMSESLKESGLKHALVNAGGDIRAFGGKRAGQPWKIAVRNPVDPGRPLKTFDLFEGACATSGDYEVYFDKNKLFHHIINPATGHSPRDFSSATVLSDTAAMADAMSTSLMLMGATGFSRFGIQARAYLLIDAAGRVSAG